MKHNSEIFKMEEFTLIEIKKVNQYLKTDKRNVSVNHLFLIQLMLVLTKMKTAILMRQLLKLSMEEDSRKELKNV